MSATQTRRSRPLLVVLTTALIVAVGAVAFAYWTSGGEGEGTGSTGSSTDFTVTASAATGPDLKPGVGTQSVEFVVANPSDGAQMLSDVTVTVANDDGTAWTSVAGCSAADYTINEPTITYADMAAGATATGTVTFTMNNTATDQEGCKDAAVPLYFVAS